MRTFAGEAGDQEQELIATMPLSSGEVVVGKWLAGSAFFTLGLAFTFPFLLTVAYLGSPDWGVATAGYFGAGLLLSTSYAIGLFSSALMRERTSAYVFTIFVLLVVTLLGTEHRARLLGAGPFVDGFGQFSPKLGLDRLATGRFEVAVVANFVVMTALALWGAILALDARRNGPTTLITKFRYALRGLLVLAIAAATMAGLSRFDVTGDATAQRLYTLHAATIAAARASNSGTTIDFYWSEHEASVPLRIRDHANRTRRLFETLARQSNGQLSLHIHDASPDTDAEWSAMAEGVQRVAMTSGDTFLLGAVLRQGDRRRTFDYFNVDHSGSLEYDVALALIKLSETRIPKVGVLSPLFTPSSIAQIPEGLSFLTGLKRSADVAVIPFFADSLPDDLDVLIIVGGAAIKPSMLYAIDQHAMRGKGLIVCLDPYTRFNPSSDVIVPVISGRLNTIADVLDHYGVRFERKVVGDSRLAATISGLEQQHTPYPFWLRAKREQFSPLSPATAGLHELIFAEAGNLDLVPGRGIINLVSTTDQSGLLDREQFKGSSPADVTAKFVTDGKLRSIAAFIPGPLTSAFSAPETSQAGHVSKRDGSAVFVVSDVDWLFDSLAVDGAGTPAARPANDNHAFLANLVDLAGRDPRLLDVRSRGGGDRRFTRVAQILEEASATTQVELAKQTAKVAKIEGLIGEVMKIAKVQRIAELPPDIRAQVQKLNLDLIPVRRQLREIRLSIRERVEALGRTLTIINVVSGPLLAGLLAILLFSTRRHRRSVGGMIRT
jgi:ABC-2 type transport system permease protein